MISASCYSRKPVFMIVVLRTHHTDCFLLTARPQVFSSYVLYTLFIMSEWLVQENQRYEHLTSSLRLRNLLQLACARISRWGLKPCNDKYQGFFLHELRCTLRRAVDQRRRNLHSHFEPEINEDSVWKGMSNWGDRLKSRGEREREGEGGNEQDSRRTEINYGARGDREKARNRPHL